MTPQRKSLLAVAAATYIAGAATMVPLLSVTAPQTVHLQPGQALQVIADSPAPSPISSTNPSVVIPSSSAAAAKPSVTLAPSLTPTPTASPVSPAPMVASGPVTVTTDGQVVQNLIIDSMPGAAMTLAGQTTGTTSSIYVNGHKNVVIRNVILRGRQNGILAVDDDNLQIDHITVSDVNYCGVCIYGGNGGSLTNSTISHIGVLRTNFSDPGQLNNAYGIKFEVGSQAGGSSNPPQNWTVDHDSFIDSPLWMGINAHNGLHMKFTNNTVTGAPRAIFVAGPLTDFTITGNQLLSPVTKSGGSTDLTAISYGDLQGGTISANSISSAFHSYVSNIDQYLAGLKSTNVAVGTNPIVP